MAETDRHDALVRVIACRLPACSEAELRFLDACMTEMQTRRLDADEAEGRANPSAVALPRLLRTIAFWPIEAGIAELLDATAVDLSDEKGG